MMQNNEAAQHAALNASLFEVVVDAFAHAATGLVTSNDPEILAFATSVPLAGSGPSALAKKAVYALGAMLRSSLAVQQHAIDSGTFATVLPNVVTVLARDLPPCAPIEPKSMAGKLIAIVDDVLSENPSETSQGVAIRAALAPSWNPAVARLRCKS